MKEMKARKFKASMAKAEPGETNAKDLFGFLAGEVKIIEAESQKQLQTSTATRAIAP